MTIYTTNAKVKVISVSMPMLASAHAKELTRVINLEEDKGCVLLYSDTYNSATYLYFQCSKKE
jgi:hypothetical protein